MFKSICEDNLLFMRSTHRVEGGLKTVLAWAGWGLNSLDPHLICKSVCLFVFKYICICNFSPIKWVQECLSLWISVILKKKNTNGLSCLEHPM